jgi:hypothetical protein
MATPEVLIQPELRACVLAFLAPEAETRIYSMSNRSRVRVAEMTRERRACRRRKEALAPFAHTCTKWELCRELHQLNVVRERLWWASLEKLAEDGIDPYSLRA